MQLGSFFTTPQTRDVADYPGWSVQFMSLQEVKQSIIADLLVTCRDLGALHWSELFHFLEKPMSIEYVLYALTELIDEGRLVEHGQFLSLREGKSWLQNHMDYCGVYIFGFPEIVYPDGLIGLSEQGHDTVEQIGVEGVVQMVMAEIRHPDATKAVQ